MKGEGQVMSEATVSGRALNSATGGRPNALSPLATDPSSFL